MYTVELNRNIPGTYTIGAETQPVRFDLQGIAAVSLLQCERDPSLVDQVTFLSICCPCRNLCFTGGHEILLASVVV